MQIISRSAANLPPIPTGFVGTRTLSSWAGVTVHHTGGPFSTWRAVHDWQTTGRPPSDRLFYIGYSFGIANGQVTELRGWDRHPAHDHENSRLGIVFGGNYQNTLPPPADLDALVWLIGEARRRTGKPSLPVITHREAWPVGDWRATSCPGDQLHNWCKRFLPSRLVGSVLAPPQKGTDEMTPDELMRHRIQRVADGETMTVATALSYTHHHAHGLRAEVTRLAVNQAAILAHVGGNNVADAVRQVLEEHRATLVTEMVELLGPALAEELATSVPAQVVEEAVTRVLSRARIGVEEPL